MNNPLHTLQPSALSRRLLLGTAIAGLLLASACSKAVKTGSKALPKDATILCLGDSLTFGFGADAGSSYPQKLEQLTGYVTQNAGVNGDTATGALQRLPGLLDANKPGLVLVSIGGNDFLRNYPVEATKASLRSIVQTASASAKVVLIGEPLPDPLAYAAGSLVDHPMYAEVASEAGVPLYSGGWSAVLSKPELRSDRIHANTEGYRLFTEKLAAWLRETGIIL